MHELPTVRGPKGNADIYLGQHLISRDNRDLTTPMVNFWRNAFTKHPSRYEGLLETALVQSQSQIRVTADTFYGKHVSLNSPIRKVAYRL